MECKSCKGEGYHFTGVEHYGMQQTQECPDCKGKGRIVTESEVNGTDCPRGTCE